MNICEMETRTKEYRSRIVSSERTAAGAIKSDGVVWWVGCVARSRGLDERTRIV